MRNKQNQTNIDNSDLINYPNGRIKNNTGAGDGTPVNEQTKGDIHEAFDKLLRLYGISHNGLPDNTANGYQAIEGLIALASKNDFIIPLSTSGGLLSVPVKLGKLLDEESFILKATLDKGAETEIKGSLDGVTKTVTFLGDFKANEYVRMIKTSGNVVLVRMVDGFNLSDAVNALAFLKAANQTEEDAGGLNTVATTPLTHLTAFTKRVIGVDSVNFLATVANDGLLSKEDKAIIDNFTSPERNYGTVIGINPASGTTGSFYPVSGNIASAQLVQKTGSGNRILITVANALDNLTYEVKMHIESLGAIQSDNDIFPPIFKKISITQFEVFLQESNSTTQNITLHASTIQR